jgi:hypothetical protein
VGGRPIITRQNQGKRSNLAPVALDVQHFCVVCF